MNRPLSPFMFPTWYRFQITSALSNSSPAHRHRAGRRLDPVDLVARLRGCGWRIVCRDDAFIASPIGMLLLFGWSIAFFYHLSNGIRHSPGTLATASKSSRPIAAATRSSRRPRY